MNFVETEGKEKEEACECEANLFFRGWCRASCRRVLREECLFLCPLRRQSPFRAAFHQWAGVGGGGKGGGRSLSALCNCHSCSSPGPLTPAES